jgi:serine phosphatase RsbU (regulator of sigma subunit)
VVSPPDTAPNGRAEAPAGASPTAIDALAEALIGLAVGTSPGDLSALVQAVAAAVGADLALVRVVEPGGHTAVVRALTAGSPALLAELEGARVPAADLPGSEGDERDSLPDALGTLAERVAARGALYLPLAVAGRQEGSLELLRRERPFTPAERALARLAAAEALVALRALHGDEAGDIAHSLALAGQGLTVGGAGAEAAAALARLALESAGAQAARLWRRSNGGPVSLAAGAGDWSGLPEHETRGLVDAALAASPGPVAVAVARVAGAMAVTIPLGRPPEGALQLLVPEGGEPSLEERAALAVFAARAWSALRASERRTAGAGELERTRGLLGVVAEANADLSVTHTLEPTLRRVADLLEIERGAIYLRDGPRLEAAAAQGLAGPHTAVAERLLQLALGPLRGRGTIVVANALRDRRFSDVAAELEETGIEAAIGAPLVVAEGVTGLLALYPPAGRTPSEDEWALLRAVTAQLAVALQNSRLHERATSLGADLEQALVAERQTARQLRALYEISRSFAQSLSLERTLEAVARTIAELVGADAAVVHMPDERGERLVPWAMHAPDARLAGAVAALLERPQPIERLPRRLFPGREALVLDPETAHALGPPYELLVPFLQKGSTAAVLPVATKQEVLGALTVVSLDPERPITPEAADLALSVARQAALAIDNARLYQQQKAFSDAMQRSLLPRENPSMAGLEVGAVYDSSARVEVGGDLYDFLELEDGRLAVVLGDVTGHGIDAAADMAMAKFVFRSLAREHPEPSDLLAAANEVVCSEIAPGKFITMAYLTVHGETGALAAAAAGHPKPRLVGGDGAVSALPVGGLALGVVTEQEYEDARSELAPGSSVVMFTDGVIEARRDGEMFGEERLDAVLAQRYGLSAQELAAAVVDACRSWSGGDLADDCAVVVVRRDG